MGDQFKHRLCSEAPDTRGNKKRQEVSRKIP